ncbi:MAG TPA: outer membrane beta-barrel protein [Gammaproteobacteria bacterium]|jgi:hypothetical protein|nr:outer membrane beta-barrel protein [Gammaproteobacteria bacterium]
MKRPTLTLKYAAITLLLAGITSTSFAEDTASQTCPTPIMLSSGWYLGLQGGYDSFKVKTNVTTPGGASTLVTNPSMNAIGWTGGMMLGYGMMLNDWFYTGAEIFANLTDAERYFTNTSAGSTYSNKVKVKSTYGIGILPGIRFTDSTLTYARLGWNSATFKTTETVTSVATATRNNTSNGFVVGVGIETYTNTNWSLRGEFDHTWYSSYNTKTVYTTGVKPSDNQFMLAMLYHFT